MKRALPIALLLAAACAETAPALRVEDVPRAQSRWPQTTLADLDRGRHVYLSRCSGCHALYSPRAYAADRWPALVVRMKKNARLDESAENDLVRYLTVASAPATAIEKGASR